MTGVQTCALPIYPKHVIIVEVTGGVHHPLVGLEENVVQRNLLRVHHPLAVVHVDKVAEAVGLDLALVLEDLICLDDDHGEIVGGELFDVVVPEEVVLAFSSDNGSIIGVVTVPKWLPTARDEAN